MKWVKKEKNVKKFPFSQDIDNLNARHIQSTRKQTLAAENCKNKGKKKNVQSKEKQKKKPKQNEDGLCEAVVNEWKTKTFAIFFSLFLLLNCLRVSCRFCVRSYRLWWPKFICLFCCLVSHVFSVKNISSYCVRAMISNGQVEKTRDQKN